MLTTFMHVLLIPSIQKETNRSMINPRTKTQTKAKIVKHVKLHRLGSLRVHMGNLIFS